MSKHPIAQLFSLFRVCHKCCDEWVILRVFWESVLIKQWHCVEADELVADKLSLWCQIITWCCKLKQQEDNLCTSFLVFGLHFQHKEMQTSELAAELSIPVFFNLFSEVELFAAILIAHGTHVFLWGDSWGPYGQNSRPNAENGFLGREQWTTS